MQSSKPVVIVGSYCKGLFTRGKRLPVSGETVIHDEYFEGPGGKGSNQAMAAAKLGADCRFIAKLGDDTWGREAIDMYRKAGIDTASVVTDASIHTGMGFILIDAQGHNQIATVPGANNRLEEADIDAAIPIIEAAGILGFQLEMRLDIVDYAIRKGRELGVTTFLDPAPAVHLSDDLLAHVDIIKPNETEASFITGVEVTDLESSFRAAIWLRERGVGTVIITLGAEGSVLVTSSVQQHYPAPVVSAIDTTGAGDIFSGAFLAEYSAGRDLPEAIEFASQAAALSTTRLGVVDAIPDRSEVECIGG